MMVRYGGAMEVALSNDGKVVQWWWFSVIWYSTVAWCD